MNKIINKTNSIGAVLFLLGIVAGWLIFSGGETTTTHNHTEEVTEWTCSMHPQIRKTEPGLCPICGMDLIPLSQSGSSVDPNGITMTEEAMKLAEIQTIIVGSSSGNNELRLFGKVQPNESNVMTETAHVPGRIEKLYVNTTGESVKKGQLIAKVYSPELVTAQKELQEAKKMSSTYPQLLEAAKEKLRYWKISESQIDKILTSGEIQNEFSVFAHTSGVVIKRNVTEGDHVQEGAMLFEIIDLSSLWIQFDGYESQLPFLKVGNTIAFTTDAVPGKVFQGTISFIDPIMNPDSRTATVRVVYNNSKGELKPDMFVTGLIKSISKTNKNIRIPQTAILWTGERSVVYIKNSSSEEPSFALREVVLGEKQGSNYLIKSGLSNGEEIVMNGAFTVDAAAQLAGKPSMMSVQHIESQQHDSHDSHVSMTKETYQSILSDYLRLKDALVGDDLPAAKKVANNIKSNVTSMGPLNKEIDLILVAKNIKNARKSFQVISNALIEMAKNSEYPETLYVQFCPMADNNKGATWLSLSDEIKNPYFGASMLNCGEVTKEIQSKK